MMPSAKFNPEISLGNILTIIGMIIAGGVAWGSLVAQGNADRKRLDDLTVKVERLVGTDEIMRARQHDLEREMVRSTTRVETLITGIAGELARISRQIERDPR
jgi:hypothetical protein